MCKKVSTTVRRVTLVLSISFVFSVPLMRSQVCRFHLAGNTFQFFVNLESESVS